MKIRILVILFLSLFFSCNSKKSKDIELQQFSKIEVKEFKKKNVSINTVLRFLNPNENSVKVIYSEFDIVVNGKDVGTFISKKVKEVTGNGLYEIPISIDFSPEDAFLNLDYGLIKIKSDVVSKVALDGFVKTEQNEQEESVYFSVEQTVLFSNNKKIFLNKDGIIEDI